MNNYNIAADFMRTVLPDDLMALGNVVFKNYSSHSKSFIFSENLPEIIDFHEKNRTALAVGIAVRYRDFNHTGEKQGGKKECVATQCLKLDFDSMEKGKPLGEDEKSKIQKILLEHTATPTTIIDSGGGIHAYYCLKEPYLLDSVDKVTSLESLNARLIEKFQDKIPDVKVDKAIKDVSRIMRVPGSYNFKYGEPRLVQILFMNDRRYDLNELSDVMGLNVEGAEQEESGPPDTHERPSLHSVEKMTPTCLDAVAISSGNCQPSGADGKPMVLYENVWEILQKRCSYFLERLHYQKEKGVEYNEFIIIVALFTRLGLSKLAHLFSRLHPKYKDSYDMRADGYVATEKVIQEVIKDQGQKGFVTCKTLGCPNRCGFKKGKGSPSPVRHLIKMTSFSRFCRGSGKGRTLLSKLAVDEIHTHLDMYYDPEQKYFYVFDGHCWHGEPDDAIKKLAAEIMGPDAEPNHIDKVFKALIYRSQENRVDIDQVKDFIPFEDGIFDIEKMMSEDSGNDGVNGALLNRYFTPYREMLHHEKLKLGLRNTLGAKFDITASMEAFEGYMNSTFSGDKDLIEYCQEVIGYCMYQPYPFHVAFLFWGTGGNGKTILANVIAALLGQDNIAFMDFSTFNRFSTSNLEGKSLCISDELPQKGSNWELFKNLTGGGWIPAERKHKPPYQFKSACKLIFMANEIPDLQDTSEGFWSRLKIIPFLNSFRCPCSRLTSNYS